MPGPLSVVLVHLSRTRVATSLAFGVRDDLLADPLEVVELLAGLVQADRSLQARLPDSNAQLAPFIWVLRRIVARRRSFRIAVHRIRAVRRRLARCRPVDQLQDLHDQSCGHGSGNERVVDAARGQINLELDLRTVTMPVPLLTVSTPDQRDLAWAESRLKSVSFIARTLHARPTMFWTVRRLVRAGHVPRELKTCRWIARLH